MNLFTPADDARPVFLTGNFNDWITADERYRMARIKEGHYQYTFTEVPPVQESFEYKYVKGGWESEELGSDGHPRVNRRMEVPKGKVSDVVPRWKTHSGGYDPKFYPTIEIVAKRFNIPQLRRRRRISVLLPWDYYLTDKHYPVLYLQDGQNLFEESAPFGTWGVDKQLASMAQRGKGNFIVVAIDHGGKERIKEFSPYPTMRWGEGLGHDYARFLAQTLKPHIDAQYRTLSDRAHTGVGGSSMGGLISIYAGFLFPEVFSRFMIFSPSLWVSNQIYKERADFHRLGETRIYLYAGGKESPGMLNNIRQFQAEMYRHGFDDQRLKIKVEIDPHGKHNEARWGREFPLAGEWLFA